MRQWFDSVLKGAAALAASVRVSIAFGALVALTAAIFLWNARADTALVFLGAGLVLTLCLALVQVTDFTRVKQLANLGAVSAEIRAGFEATRDGRIAQTFIGANLIAGASDYVQRIPAPASGRVSVDRYFVISSAFDINFAAHSVELSESLRQGGIEVRNYFWSDPDSIITADISWNLTAFRDRAVISVSSRDDQKGGSATIMKASDSKDVIGLLVEQPGTSDFLQRGYLERLHRVESVTLATAKRQILDANRKTYVSAAVHAVVKEWLAKRSFAGGGRPGTEKVHCAAIVGSFARSLHDPTYGQLREHGGGGWGGAVTENDVDVLVFVIDLVHSDLDELTQVAKRVLERFAIPGSIEFTIDASVAPVGSLRGEGAGGDVVVHLIVNDAELRRALRPSPLVASHRVETAVMVHGSQADLRTAYGDPAAPDPRVLLSAPLGVTDLLKQLESRTMTVRYWDPSATMQERFQAMTVPQIQRFAEYATKWISINLLRVLGTTARAEHWQAYTRTHCEALGISMVDLSPRFATTFAAKVKKLLEQSMIEDSVLPLYRSRFDELWSASE